MYAQDLKLDFCQQFNYPKEIHSLLKKIVGLLHRKGVLSVMALGSLPRGELSYKVRNADLVVFSDIDISVIAEDKISQEEQVFLIRKLKELKKIFQPQNPLFDINIEFFSLEDFKRLPFKVRFYELKESGKVLFGQDLRYVIPKFDINKQDIKDTNNIILRRLLYTLLYFPRELLEDKKIDFTQDILKYVVARNALDIATVLLFQKGIFLSSYREKVKYIVSRPDEFTGDFGPGLSGFLTRCLKIKLDMDFNQSLLTLLEDAFGYFRLLLSHTLKNNGVNLERKESLLPLIKKAKNDIFGDSDITRTKFKFVLGSPNLNILQKRLNALSYSFLGCIIFFLFNMNESAYLFLKADRQCLRVLDDSWWALMRLGILGGKGPLPMDFVNRFLVLRERFFFGFYTKFMAPTTAQHIEEILNYRYA